MRSGAITLISEMSVHLINCAEMGKQRAEIQKLRILSGNTEYFVDTCSLLLLNRKDNLTWAWYIDEESLSVQSISTKTELYVLKAMLPDHFYGNHRSQAVNLHYVRELRHDTMRLGLGCAELPKVMLSREKLTEFRLKVQQAPSLSPRSAYQSRNLRMMMRLRSKAA